MGGTILSPQHLLAAELAVTNPLRPLGASLPWEGLRIKCIEIDTEKGRKGGRDRTKRDCEEELEGGEGERSSVIGNYRSELIAKQDTTGKAMYRYPI